MFLYNTNMNLAEKMLSRFGHLWAGLGLTFPDRAQFSLFGRFWADLGIFLQTINIKNCNKHNSCCPLTK